MLLQADRLLTVDLVDQAEAIYRQILSIAPKHFDSTHLLGVVALQSGRLDEAMRLILPNLQMMGRLRTGQPLGPLDLVEDAEQQQVSPHAQAIVDAGLHQAVVGSPAEAADQLHALAERFDVDEVMIHPVASAFRGTDPSAAPAREVTLELLAKELL